ncbi:MAG: heparinase II/III family protein, partial [Clostridia bacterium]|nr:heparinase II/III family protein [Clostridia bacterium]
MGRKIFAERGYNVTGRVVPYSDFKMFVSTPQGFKINEAQYPYLIARGENQLKAEIPQLIASDYMMFKRDGNRSIYEGKYFPRRNMVIDLAVAEYVEGKGRFLDKLIDVLWLILEETTWVIPAHNPGKEGVNTCLPYAYTGHVDYIDLFAATTAATLSFVYYLCHDKFDTVTTLINQRLLFEINRRIIEPFMSDADLWSKCWWSGIRDNEVNNWCPWIVSNVLTVCALTVKDQATRTTLVRKSLPMLDAFTAVYHSDGGCDEGPSYWNAAGAALYNAGLVLYDLTAGYINIFDDPLVKNMGEYAVKVVISHNRVLNFADSPCRTNPSALILYDWGKCSNSEMMTTFAQSRMGGKLPKIGADTGMPYRSFKYMCMETPENADYKAPSKFYLDGIIVAGTREDPDPQKGLYLALKGGHNAESHNHNDLGNIIVFADGNPLFIDAGSGRYTRRTFSSERYTIWAMASDYHNCATVNGITQKAGRQYRSSDEIYDEESGKLTLNLKTAYPAECDIAKYTRSAVLENGEIVIEDDIELNKDGTVSFHYLVNKAPDGYYLSVFNHSGIVRTKEKGDEVLPSATKTATTNC